MDFVVVIQHEDRLATAGVRIRYDRLRPQLEALGHRLTLATIESFRANDSYTADAYLISKCHDARSIVLAHALRAAGRHVGVDVFDDYYSQTDDSRFVHLRQWLTRIRPSLTFALCATDAMAERLASLIPNVPVHVLNDPFGAFDAEAIASRVQRKLEATLATGHIDIAWFGIGDNPHFPVGIEDLSAYEATLAAIRSAGFEPRLSVLTNRRALTVRRLEMLARLPATVTIEEWTEPLEAQLLETNLVSFLPVNAQPFSSVKSLNRAVTALTGSTQVLSVGHPLYAALGSYIYRDATTLVRDLVLRRLKVRRETLPGLQDLMRRLADPAVETERLIGFLGTLVARPPAAQGRTPLALVHGISSTGAVHKFVQRMQGLSVASPFFATTVNVDVRVEQDGDRGLHVLLSDRAAGLVSAGLRGQLVATPAVDGRVSYRLPLTGGLDRSLATAPPAGRRMEAIADYPNRMAAFLATLEAVIPGVRVVVSEQASPYWVGSRSEGHAAGGVYGG